MQVDQVLRILLALLPVLLFLAGLRVLDSYKLVPVPMVAAAISAGAAAAVVCYFINSALIERFANEAQYTHFVSPVIEETVKSAYWIFLIATSRVAFMVDSAICGFAVGAGFALAENIFFLNALESHGLALWILRGFGTAVMHGGAAAIGAFVSVYFSESRKWRGLRQFAPGVAAAILLHALFNQGWLSPAGSMAAVMTGLPLIFLIVFYISEQSLRRWMAGKLDQDIEMLAMIESGEFKQTPQGAYLMSLNESFRPEVRGDMLTLLHLTIELSARAQGALLLREAGLEVPLDSDLDSRFKELRYLQKSIGPTGMLAVRPLLKQTPRDLWELHHLTR